MLGQPRLKTHWLEVIFRPFRRVTTSGRYIAEIDGLRFIAIGTVFFQHIQQVAANAGTASGVQWDATASLIERTRIGVELFFVISGFILALPFASNRLRGDTPVSLPAYYKRRLTRLEPPYVLCMLLCFVWVVLGTGLSAREMLPHLLAHLGYVHNLVYQEFSPINSVVWTLEIEVQFYLLAPLLATVFLIPRRLVRRLAILFIAFVDIGVVHLWLKHYGGMRPSLIGSLPFFLAGFMIADLYCCEWDTRPKSRRMYDLLAFLGWSFLPLLWLRSSPATYMPFILFFLVFCSFQADLFRSLLRSPVIATTGGMCYSIYLIHLKLMWAVSPWLKGFAPTRLVSINGVILCVVLGLPILLVSAVYFGCIERPCMKKDWPQRLWAWLRQKRSVPTEDSPGGSRPLPPVPTRR